MYCVLTQNEETASQQRHILLLLLLDCQQCFYQKDNERHTNKLNEYHVF